MFIKKDEINDLNDVSLVNPDLEKTKTFTLIASIVLESLHNMLPFLLILLSDNTALIFLSNNFDKQNLIDLQFNLSIIYFVLLFFVPGIINFLNFKEKLKKLYFKTVSISIIFVIFVYTPFILSLFFFCPNKSWVNFTIFTPSFVLFKLIMIINLRIFDIRKLYVLNATFIVLFMIFHILLTFLLTVGFELGLLGVSLALNISYLVGCILSLAFLKSFTRILNQNISNNKDNANYSNLHNNNLNENLINNNSNNAIYTSQKNNINIINTNNNSEGISYFFSNIISSIKGIFYNKNQKANKIDKKDSQYNLSKALYRPSNELTGVSNIVNLDNFSNNNNNTKTNLQNKYDNKFTLHLFNKYFSFIVSLSAISALKYLGFSLLIIISYYVQTKDECIINIIVLNTILISIIICYSYSNTLTNYISNESFHHSHSNKHRYTKMCCTTLLIVTIIVGTILLLTSRLIPQLFVNNNEFIIKNASYLIKLYVFFIVLQYATVIIDCYIISSSENYYISFILSCIYSFIVVPLTFLITKLYSFNFYFIWYGYFFYTVVQLIIGILYISINKK